MTDQYEDYLKKHVLQNPDCERMEARGLIIQDFGFAGRQLPGDFPKELQVRWRITGLKYQYKTKDYPK